MFWLAVIFALVGAVAGGLAVAAIREWIACGYYRQEEVIAIAAISCASGAFSVLAVMLAAMLIVL